MGYRCAQHEQPHPGCTICELARPPARTTITRAELAEVCERHTVPATSLAPLIAVLRDLGLTVEDARGADDEPDIEITAKALFAVHNDQVIDGQLQFVERSYVLPTTVVGRVHRLLADYEMPGTARVVLVEQ